MVLFGLPEAGREEPDDTVDASSFFFFPNQFIVVVVVWGEEVACLIKESDSREGQENKNRTE